MYELKKAFIKNTFSKKDANKVFSYHSDLAYIEDNLTSNNAPTKGNLSSILTFVCFAL